MLRRNAIALAEVERDAEIEELEHLVHRKDDAIAALECRLERLEDQKHHLEQQLEAARGTIAAQAWVLLAGAGIGAWRLLRRD